MPMTVSDFIVSRLSQWGVRRVFGYPGDGINGMFGALARSDDGIEFIQARHEEMAAFMASAHAKFTGELGVCIATSGPGASHLITGLYDARLDHQPVLAIVGQQARSAIGGHYQQEIDLPSMLKDVAGAFVGQAMVPQQVAHLVDRAIRTALGERRVTALILPNDLQELEYQPPSREHGMLNSGVGYNTPRVLPQQEDLEHAAEILNSGKKIALLVGAGALGATAEVTAVADRLAAGAAKALLGKAALDDSLDWVTGSIGLLGTEPTDKMMAECDTLLMIGSGFPYAEFLPDKDKACGVQIDLKADMLGLRYPMDVHLHGDSAETLSALLPLLKQNSDQSWRQQISEWNQDWHSKLEARALAPAERDTNPQRSVFELSKQLPHDAIVTSDSGSCANWYARDLAVKPSMLCSLSGGLASMGAAVPYAIAAKFAHPHRPVIALVGDGAMQMSNMAELVTVAKYWKQWPDQRWICMVLNNADLNQVTWEQRAVQGDPKFAASQDIPDVPYHRFAELIGLRGILVDKDEDIADAWKQALSSDRPVVLEIKSDPNVPPLPPHLTLEQAKAFASSMLGGDPDARSVLKNTARQVLSSVLPKRTEKETS